MTMPQTTENFKFQKYRSKEISWLSFNARVLQEAANKEVPLLERLRYLGIYSNNLDEFFSVRVATLKRIAAVYNKKKFKVPHNPDTVLKRVQEIVIAQRKKYEKVYIELLSDLSKQGIYIINENQLDENQEKFVRSFFKEKVRPHLMPVMLGQTEKFPDMKDDMIYLAVSLIKHSTGKVNYALIEIPSNLIPRFISLPSANGESFIIFLDDVIRCGLKDIFYTYDFDEISAYTIKLTKDAELDIDDDFVGGYVSKIKQSLENRKRGNPVRFVYDAQIPVDLLEYIIRKLNLSASDAIISGGRYHNSRDFIKFPTFNRADLVYEPLKPIPIGFFEQHKSLFKAIAERDCLLHFPYHSFSHFIDLLREASIDPKVKEIKITLYRLGKNSSVINALLGALKNGKQVTAVIELQARFDEEANIYWSNKLRNMGARVIYGVQDLKVHSKLCLITRKEKKNLTNYACVGTGNFNEDTTSVFSDHLLLTADERITSDVVKIFEFFDKNYKVMPYKHLLVAPFYMRKKIIRLITNEIKAKEEGHDAFIYLKLNNLVDDEIIDHLYKANQVGVDVRLNIRGMFSLIPEIPQMGVKIPSIGIIDRFLEHSRFLIFGNRGQAKYYLSSADLMPRNLDRRVETICPVYDKDIQKKLQHVFDLQWRDNVKARILDNHLVNKYRTGGDEKHRSQYEIYDYIKENEGK